MARFLRAEGGVTLAETLIVIGIMSTALAMVGSPMVGVLKQDEDWRVGLIATTTLQQAYRWVSKDAVNAEVTSLTDGAVPVSNLAFDWTDTSGTPHTVVYAMSGTDLVRTLDGVNSIAARNVASVAFSRSSNMLTFTISVNSSGGGTDSKTTTHFLRSLE